VPPEFPAREDPLARKARPSVRRMPQRGNQDNRVADITSELIAGARGVQSCGGFRQGPPSASVAARA